MAFVQHPSDHFAADMSRGRLRNLVVLAMAAMAAVAFLSGSNKAFATGASGSVRGGTRAQTLRRAEAFDPFGWKAALKDTLGIPSVQDLLDKQSGGANNEEPEPSEVEERMIIGIFEKFDVDGDKFLNVDEFNALQVATEGPEAVYNAEQLKALLLNINPDLEKPERGLPFADYRRLYVDERLRQAYSIDLRRDHAKIFGAEGIAAVEAEVKLVRSFTTEGAAVRIEGLSGAVELNGKSGRIVAPLADEAQLVAEGRLVLQLDDSSERIAVKPGNIRANMRASAQTSLVD